jgi:hypothetical protein
MPEMPEKGKGGVGLIWGVFFSRGATEGRTRCSTRFLRHPGHSLCLFFKPFLFQDKSSKNIAIIKINHYFCRAKKIGVWRSWLAYMHGVHVVVRSSRITPTDVEKGAWSPLFLIQLFGYVRL